MRLLISMLSDCLRSVTTNSIQYSACFRILHKLNVGITTDEGVRIAAPLQNSNITGVYLALQTYNKPTLDAFTEDLAAAIQPHPRKTAYLIENPKAIVEHMDAHLDNFLQMGYTNHLTIDTLFTTLMITQIPNESKLKVDAIEAIQKYQAEVEKARDDDYTDDDHSTSQTSHSKVVPSPPGGPDDASVLTTMSSPQNLQSSPVPLSLYRFLSNFIAQRQEAMDYGNNPGIKKPTYVDDSGFDAPSSHDAYTTTLTQAKVIPHDAKQYTTSTKRGIQFPYVALPNKCEECHSTDSTFVPKHKPQCYHKKCKHCNLWGHPDYACRVPKPK